MGDASRRVLVDDAIDAPEDFLHVVLDWDGGRYRGDMRGHHIMSERDIADLRNDVSRRPRPTSCGNSAGPTDATHGRM